MKKVTVIMLAASLLWVNTACDDKEEEVFENVILDVQSPDMAENGGDPHTEGPGGG